MVSLTFSPFFSFFLPSSLPLDSHTFPLRSSPTPYICSLSLALCPKSAGKPPSTHSQYAFLESILKNISIHKFVCIYMIIITNCIACTTSMLRRWLLESQLVHFLFGAIKRTKENVALFSGVQQCNIVFWILIVILTINTQEDL